MKKKFRALSLVLVFCLIAGLTAFGASADKLQWNYQNSIEVFVTVAEQTSFTPESFPEVSCVEAIVTKKEKKSDKYDYRLFLVLRTDGSDEAIEAAITAVKANKIVTNAYRNPFVPFESEITLNQSKIKLKVGEQADLKIVKEHIYSTLGATNSLRITLDHEVYDLNAIDKNLFADYGITLGNQILIDGSTPSGNFTAEAVGKTARETFDIIDALSQLPGILSVDFDYLLSGALPGEIWETSNSACADFTEDLSTGEKIHTIGKTVTVKGLKSGTAEISVKRSPSNPDYATAKCTVLVYTPGDLTESNDIAIDDAVLLFKHIAGKATLGENQLNAADFNEDGDITLSDAILLFKQIAGK